MLSEREVTPRMAEANRQNSHKSTGPRTPEGKQRVRYNALQDGFYGMPRMELMVAGHENPREYQQLRIGLKESLHPFTPAQHMLVDDLSMLRWQKLRNQRSQAAQINFRMEQLDTDSEELQKQYDRDGMSFNRAEVGDKGMANMPDCPAKFEQMLKSLALLLDQVERRQFHIDASPTLQLLYGKQPSLRANSFFDCFHRFLTQRPNGVEYEQLRRDLIDEQKEWNEKYQFYVRRHVEISQARRNLCFAPTEKEWTLLLRQEASLDRQIERKTRLLWEMQEVDRKRRHDEEWHQITGQQAEEAPTEVTAQQAGASGGDADQEMAQEQAGAVTEPPSSKIQEQSRHPIESKGPASENKAEEPGPGTAGQASDPACTTGSEGQGVCQGTTNPADAPRGP